MSIICGSPSLFKTVLEIGCMLRLWHGHTLAQTKVFSEMALDTCNQIFIKAIELDVFCQGCPLLPWMSLELLAKGHLDDHESGLFFFDFSDEF